jgi:basic amino acid/polyamine antiporter, APA family
MLTRMQQDERERTDNGGLVRHMGRVTLVALMLNSVIGSGIFGLPANLHGLLGHAAPMAYLLAAVGIGLIMACFAEVGSQFPASGGVYLYARAAFGRFAGIQMGWMALMVRVSAHAAIANLLVVYLGEFVPSVTAPAARAVTICGVLGVLAGINVLGIRQGALVSNLFTIGKLAPLVLFVGVGFVLLGDRVPLPAGEASAATWAQALLVLMFAYGGFESALIPMGEAKDPRRDIPIALGIGIVCCAVLYTAIHVVVMAALPDPSASTRPLADAARVLAGPAGAAFMAAGAVVSIVGILGAGMVNTPRLPFALAERGDFPRVLAAIHPRYRTPYISLLLYAAAVCLLAITGSFIWNAVLSAAGRLLTYGLVCGALLQLRRTHPDADAFRVPGGRLVAMLGLGFAATLVVQMGLGELLVILVTIAVALVNWMWVRHDGSTDPGHRPHKSGPYA